MSYKKGILYIGAILLFTLVACSGGQTTEEKIYEYMEEAVQLEASFGQQQDEIVQLERQEQEIFNQISELKSDESDQRIDLSKQALEIIEEREEKINLEKESLESSQQTFKKINDLLDEINEEAVKEQAVELYDVMIERYEFYGNLYEAYVHSLDEEEALYTLLQKDDVTEDQISDQIEKVNQYYEQVIENNKLFNEKTVNYNELKKAFYDVADIDVTYDED